MGWIIFIGIVLMILWICDNNAIQRQHQQQMKMYLDYMDRNLREKK